MVNAKQWLEQWLETSTEEPDWANMPLDESFLENMPPLSAEARADHEQGMDFHRRLNDLLENHPECQGAMKWFIPIRSTESVAEANRNLDERVQYLHDRGAHDLAAELPLWSSRGSKRMRGSPPEEPLDDRPIIYFQDPLLWGYEASLIKKPSASQEEVEKDEQGDRKAGGRGGKEGERGGEEGACEQGGKKIWDWPTEDTAAEAGMSGPAN
ncbi:MAG: hypothetical protein Q9160_006109 [Pyrenula sp. 1 TL-2023]